MVEQVLQYEVIALEDLIQARRGARAEASTERRPEGALQHPQRTREGKGEEGRRSTHGWRHGGGLLEVERQ